MSEPSAVEQEQEAPVRREAATGPLLPQWFIKGFYAVFTVFAIVSIFLIVTSVIAQGSMTAALSVIGGDAEVDAADPEGPEAAAAMDDLLVHPKEGFLYLNQALLQPEHEDARMLRALALRKAIAWGVNSARRDAIGKVLDNMEEDGQVSADFALTDDLREVLADLVAERRSDPGMTYAEDQITSVLAWLGDGYPGKPKGPETRRLKALGTEYGKKRFAKSELAALAAVMEKWGPDSARVPKNVAGPLGKMLRGERAELDPDAAALCEEEAERWEDLYRNGMACLAIASRKTALEIARLTAAGEVRTLDHPHLYQYLSLLDSRFEEVRDEIGKGSWELRHNRFTFMFLSEFATRTAINPAMAVETARFTREEHEREMSKANRRRILEAIDLLARVAVDYVQDPGPYILNVADDDEFVRQQVVGRLREIVDEETIGPLAEAALQRVREADMARPGGPILFAAP